jgi:hypothetical protein
MLTYGFAERRTVVLPAANKHDECNRHEAQREPVGSREANMRLYVNCRKP